MYRRHRLTQLKLIFVPPINCSTPNIVDNIPLIESIEVTYNGGLNIVTETAHHQSMVATQQQQFQ
jgi:hypothetical protein